MLDESWSGISELARGFGVAVAVDSRNVAHIVSAVFEEQWPPAYRSGADFEIVELDSSGRFMRAHRYGERAQYPSDIALSGDDRYVVGTALARYASETGFIARIDGDGVLRWLIDTPPLRRVAVAPDGSVLALGADLLTFSPDGILTATVKPPPDEFWNAVAADSSGLYLAGVTAPPSRAFVEKRNAAGVTAWRATLPTPYRSAANALALGPGGSVAVAGRSALFADTFGQYDWVGFVAQIGSNGALTRYRELFGGGLSRPADGTAGFCAGQLLYDTEGIAIGADGTLWVSGTFDNDAQIVTVAPDGSAQWLSLTTDGADEVFICSEPGGIAVGSNGVAVVTGATKGERCSYPATVTTFVNGAAIADYNVSHIYVGRFPTSQLRP